MVHCDAPCAAARAKPHLDLVAPQAAADAIRAIILTNVGHAGKRVAVERNGDIVPRSLHAEQTLQARDRIEIVHAIGGG